MLCNFVHFATHICEWKQQGLLLKRRTTGNWQLGNRPILL